MTLNIPIPDGLNKAAVDDLPEAAREFVAVRLYRTGQLSHGKVAAFLGIERSQVDEVLARHGVVDMTPDELGKELESARRLGQ